MIDRSYLPFDSARLYQDRGMAKWMGFFLSEHSQSLDSDKKQKHISSLLSPSEKLLYLGQAYSQQVVVQVTLFEDNNLFDLVGKISEIGTDTFQLKNKEMCMSFNIDHLITIELEDRQTDETTCL